MKHCFIALGVLVLVLGFMIIRKPYTKPLYRLNSNKDVVLQEITNSDMKTKVRDSIYGPSERAKMLSKLGVFIR
jgi:hypothetical protein